VKWQNWCPTIWRGQQRRRSNTIALRGLLGRYRPGLELLEVRLTPSGVVLQTPIPLAAGQIQEAAGYSAELFSAAPSPTNGNAKGNPHAFQDISQGQGTAILTNTDDSFVEVPIGFNFTFFGVQYNTVWVTSNGLMSFSEFPSDTGYTDYAGTDLTTNTGPNRPLIAPLWDDWVVASPGNVYYATLGNAGSREFIAEWDNVAAYPTSPSTVTFEVALLEGTNSIEFRYENVVAGSGLQPNVHDNGMNATIGIRSGFPNATASSPYASGSGAVPDGVGGIQIGYDGGPSNQPVIQGGTSIVFTPNVFPGALALAGSSVGENDPVGTLVGNFFTAATDYPYDSFTYSLVNGTASNDNALFTISGNQLETNTVFTYGPQSQYNILVQTENLVGATLTQPFTVDVVHVNQPPVVPANQTFSVTQGTPAGAAIGTVAASDPNTFQQPPPVLTYRAASEIFAIDANTGQLTVRNQKIIDNATGGFFTVPVTVTDNGNPQLSTTTDVTVNVVAVPLTATITGAPKSSPEGTAVPLSSVVTDANGQTFTYAWSVTRNGLPLTTGINTPTDGPSFSFTPANAGTYVVSLTVTDQRGQTVTATAEIIGTNVPAEVNVGAGNSISSTAKAFTRTISFTAPGKNEWSVTVDYGDGTTESFALTPGEHGYDPQTKTFTLQHLYSTATNFEVTVTITDNEGGSGTATFPVAVFDPMEFARLVAFAVGVADADGAADVNLDANNVIMSGVLTGGLPGDTLGLALLNGDPETDNLPEQGGVNGLIPTDNSGDTATPLLFVDTRAVTLNSAVVGETYELVVPTSIIGGPVKLYWFNQALGTWQSVTGGGTGTGVFEVSPLLDSAGNPTGKSLIRFYESYTAKTNPTVGQLNGTVFSIAIPAGNTGASSANFILPSIYASNAAVNAEVSVRTTGFGSGSKLAVSLQESQLGLALTGLAGARVPEAPGEAMSTDSDLLNWLINGELWDGRRRPTSNQDQSGPPGTDPPPFVDNSVPQDGAVPELEDYVIEALFAAEADCELLCGGAA
jgi:hypothetical protein